MELSISEVINNTRSPKVAQVTVMHASRVWEWRTKEVNLIDRANLESHGVGIWKLVLVEVCCIRVDEAAGVEIADNFLWLAPVDDLQKKK